MSAGKGTFAKARRARELRERDVWIFASAFLALLMLGLVVTAPSGTLGAPQSAWVLLLLAAGAIAACAPALFGRYLWHLLANHVGVRAPKILAAPRVIDGDTIEDAASGARYRLANIDAPETGDGAKCFHEGQRGELSKLVAMRLVQAAHKVEVRETFRVDRYGRRVAFVSVDGRDVGKFLISKGLARNWLGQRLRWCGKNGGLAKIARTGLMRHACRTCRTWE